MLSAQYQRAFVKALPTYTGADNYLSEAATFLARTVNWACKAVGGLIMGKGKPTGPHAGEMTGFGSMARN